MTSCIAVSIVDVDNDVAYRFLSKLVHVLVFLWLCAMQCSPRPTPMCLMRWEWVTLEDKDHFGNALQLSKEQNFQISFLSATDTNRIKRQW